LPTKLVVAATSLDRSKKITSGRSSTAKSSTNRTNFLKIGTVDVAIIGLKEIAKNIIKIKQLQNTSPPSLRSAQSGWANSSY